MSEILDIEKILEMVPHRYPSCLLDRLTKVEKDEFASGIKKCNYERTFFSWTLS